MASMLSAMLAFSVLLSAIFSGISAQAAVNEPREAWISTDSFDGKTFNYTYIAYDASEPVQDAVKISCEYGSSAFGILLKAVDVRILIDANFNSPGTQVPRSGSVDVRKAVSDCQRQLPNGRNAVAAPVAIHLPRISVSSEDPDTVMPVIVDAPR